MVEIRAGSLWPESAAACLSFYRISEFESLNYKIKRRGMGFESPCRKGFQYVTVMRTSTGFETVPRDLRYSLKASASTKPVSDFFEDAIFLRVV